MRFEAGENEAGRRLDRVLKKVLRNAPLALVYRIIRKDVKVNGRRVSGETLLKEGDAVEIFLPDGQIEALGLGRPSVAKAKKQFGVVFEDESILVVNKPFGLLTHGDAVEKKNTLANQVVSYLAEKGIYIPGVTKTFAPAPANRLDRNTTGLVLFGKALPAARDLAVMMRGGAEGPAYVEKYYLTVVKGSLKTPLALKARMIRDEGANVTRVLPSSGEEGRDMVTEVRPLAAGNGFTFVEAKLLTGRTHQIRAQLADAGYPVVGDRKYGDAAANRMVSEKYELTTQLLHAYRLTVVCGAASLEYLKGKTFRAEPPARFAEIAEGLGCCMKMKL
ncbi:MAG: RluA family pseudouridine synthase [Clostridiales Family XIII bacterium]|nr:RluA family pseudouridine synthase [Clostridiales Family XIII bacterium]